MGLSAFEKVDKLLEGIDQGAPQMIHNAKTVIRLDDNMKNDFTLACNKLSEFISKETIPSTSNRVGGNRTISAYRGRGAPRGGRNPRGRGRGRTQRHNSRLNTCPRYLSPAQLLARFPNANPNDTRTTINGVNVQDPNTEFTDDQYRTLVAANYVPTLKYRRAVLRQQQRGSSSGVASLRTQNESLTRRLAVVEGIMNAQQSNETPTNAADETITVDSHSTRPNSAPNGTRPNSASNGTQFGSGAYKRPRISGIMSIRRIQQVKSDVVQGTTQADTKARIESDSHADTCALGSNFLLVETTEWTCTVQPFHKEYAAQDNIPVVTGATAYDDPATGETVILIFHQSLWFGSSLENSLICPQQVRSYGVSMCDDPYDPNRPLGMKCEDGTVIPFNVKKSMIGVTTRCPSLQEYESCRHLVMTSPQIWDPTSKDLPHHSQDAHVDSLESWHHFNTRDYHITQSSESDSLLSSISSALTPQMFMEKFRSLRLTSAIDSQGRYTRNSADTIAKTFQVSL